MSYVVLDVWASTCDISKMTGYRYVAKMRGNLMVCENSYCFYGNYWKTLSLGRTPQTAAKLLQVRTYPNLRSAIIWDITQRRMVILNRRFGTTYRSHLQGLRSPIPWTSWSFSMGLIGWPETHVNDYHSTLRNNPEEHRSYQYRCGSLKSFPNLFIITSTTRIWTKSQK